MLFNNLIDLGSFKISYDSLKDKYTSRLDKLDIIFNKRSIYFISLKSKEINLDLSNVLDNSLIIFSNCKNLDVLNASDFLKIKSKKINYFFHNCKNLFFLEDFKSKKFVYKNKVVIEKSDIYYTHLFFNSENLIYNQENFLLTKSNFFENDLLILSKNQKNILNINNIHLSKRTNSNTTIKNILKDFSFVKYAGLIKILKIADFSKAYLETNTMLLSKNAKSINIPMLEIIPKNIIATHAATVEHVTSDELFYLGSRGLSKKKARNLIIISFLRSNISNYSETLKKYISNRTKEKL